jgi:hypothetical protein
MPSSPVRVTFEGLMIFRRDRSADLFDVGILEAKNLTSVGLPGIPDHSFKITITPDPTSGSGQLTINDRLLAQYLAQGKIWNLDVVDANGNVRKGIWPRITTARLNRHDTDRNQRDFSWLMNMQELNGSVPVQPGHLKPVIRITNGLLSTINKTDGIDLIRGTASAPSRTHFGFVAETAGLDIELLPGEAVVLRVGNTRIFRVNYDSSVPYQIAIENVAPLTAHMHNAPDHFQVYYGLLFSGIGGNDRYKLELTEPREASPNPPDMESDDISRTAHTNHSPTAPPGSSIGVQMATINPYKCGGLTVGDGDGPLG